MKPMKVEVTVPPHFQKMKEERREEFELVQQLLVQITPNIHRQVETVGKPVSEICVLVTWNNTSDHGVGITTMDQKGQADFLKHLRMRADLGIDSWRMFEMFKTMIEQPAEGFVRVMLLMQSGTSMALRMGIGSAGSVGWS
jgi:hypothetical protein